MLNLHALSLMPIILLLLLQILMRKSQKLKRQPMYGKLLTTYSEELNIMIFTQQIYEIGRGGFGKCYLGKLCAQKGKQLTQQQFFTNFEEMIDSKQVVVVKLIPKNIKKPNNQIYQQEIDNLASLYDQFGEDQCKNILRVYPYKIQSDNNYYMVTEYCYHSTLADLLQIRKRKKISFNFGQFLEILMDLLKGYGLLRKKNILHNDIKPQNIFIKNRICKIGDFGISAKLKQDKSITVTEVTSFYSSPQKFQNKPVDHKSDIYSLGIILHLILFGQHPYYDSESWRTYYKIKIQLLRQQESQYQILIPEKQQSIIHQSHRLNQNRIFVQYLKDKQKLSSPQKLDLVFDQKHKQIIMDLRKMVRAMCELNVQKRLTYERVMDQLQNVQKKYTLKLNKLSRKFQRFVDLKDLRSSDLNFQIQNLPIEQISKIFIQNKHKLQLIKTETVFLDKTVQIKELLIKTKYYYQQFYDITIELINYHEIRDKNTFQESNHLLKYLFWFCKLQSLNSVKLMFQLQQNQKQQVLNQNIQKIIFEINQTCEQIMQLIKINSYQQYKTPAQFEKSRIDLCKYLKENCLNNIVITQQNYKEYYLLFLLNDILQFQSKNFHKFNKQDTMLTLERIKKKKEEMIIKNRVEYKSLFSQRQKMYVIYYNE